MKRNNRGTNLTRSARSRGGRRSASIQRREGGRFAGKSAARTAWDDTRRMLGDED